MEQLKSINMKSLTRDELTKIKGGNPVLGGLGILGTLIGLGKAADVAGAWFLDGWNHPQ